MSVLSPITKAVDWTDTSFKILLKKNKTKQKPISKLKLYPCERLRCFSFGTASVQGKPWFQFRAHLMLGQLTGNIKTNYSFLKKEGKEKKRKENKTKTMQQIK